MATNENLAWRSPAPLWQHALSDGPTAGGLVPERFQAPTLLRFSGDGFMDELQQVLDRDPGSLAARVAQAETWRTPAVGWSRNAASARAPITLFQPVQNRYYLTAASLVCQRQGLPDRRVEPRRQERAAFLMRRLVAREGQVLDPTDSSTYDEHGWFGDRSAGLWLPLDDPALVHTAEERLPLFPIGYSDGGRSRRFWAGLIPVGFREAYEAGARRSLPTPSASAPTEDPLGDPRVAGFSATLVEALASLAGLPDDLQPERETLIRDSLTHSCLDLGLFLAAELPVLWAADGSTVPDSASDLYDRLSETVAGALSWLDLAHNAYSHRAQILAGDTAAPGILIAEHTADFTSEAVRDAAEDLLGTEDTSGAYPEYELVTDLKAALDDPRAATARTLLTGWSAALADWPGGDTDAQTLILSQLLYLADWLAQEIPALWQALSADDPAGLGGSVLELWNLFGSWGLAGIDGRALLRGAAAHRRDILLGEPTPTIALVAADPSAATLSAGLAALMDGGLAAALTAALPATVEEPLAPAEASPTETHYLVRCVLDLSACRGLRPSLVSAPSRPFRLASFFDPDAPARQVNLRMPVDTSIAGLRRFPKNVSVLISRQLRAQMERVQGIRISDTDEIELTGNESSFDLGLACSLSIPIITICALILLMIIVQILNIVFFWLPYFVICLPRFLGGRS